MKTLTLVVVFFMGLALTQATRQEPQAKNRPVSKVITLLKDMQAALEKEAEEDEAVYEKMQCWCETGAKEKAAAIEEAEKRIAELTAFLEQAAAIISQLETEIANLEKEIAANRDALAQALAIREKERAEHAAFAKETTAAIGALNAAITVLSKHHAPPQEALINIASILRHHMNKYKAVATRALSMKQRRAVASFIQQPQDYFGARPTFKDAYAPQSGEIFGILGNMKDNFEADLAEANKEEEEKEHAYQDLKAAKEAEIAAAEENVESKKQQLADTRQKLATAKQDIEDTRDSLGADQQYLMDLQSKCQMTDAEWAERQKTRSEETEAVTKAIAILSSDDAHDLFSRTFTGATSFIQSATHHKVVSYRRRRAASILKRVAARVNDDHAAALIQLAARAQLDAFEEVKHAIDGMVEQLKKETADEIAHKDWCVNELNENERQTEMKTRDKGDLQIKIDGLTTTIDGLTKEVTVLESEIAELQKQIQAAGEDREKENMDFQATVKDAQETQKLLEQALGVLKGFYNKGAFVQTRGQAEPAGPPPPPGFQEYKNQAGSSGVVAMIEEIMKDAATLEKEAIHSEQDAQAAYETFVKDSNASVEAKQRDITNKLAAKAQAEADLTQNKEDLAGVVTELESLASFAQQVHSACDFVLKNFDIRQAARAQEIDALGQAKAILSGMKSQ